MKSFKVGDEVDFITSHGQVFKNAVIYEIKNNIYKTYSKNAEENRLGYTGNGKTSGYGCWDFAITNDGRVIEIKEMPTLSNQKSKIRSIIINQ